MNEALKIQERLKEIATELSALSDAEEGLTEEQQAQLVSLEKESDELTVKLSEIREDESRAAIKAKAEALRNFAKDGKRLTTSGATGPRLGRQRLAVEDDPKRGFKCLAHFAERV